MRVLQYWYPLMFLKIVSNLKRIQHLDYCFVDMHLTAVSYLE